MPWPRRAALGLSCVTAAVLIVDVGVVSIAGQLGARVHVGVAGCIAVGTIGLAAVISRHGASNPVAALLAWMALLVSVAAFSDNYLPAQTRRSDLLPALSSMGAAVLVVTWVWLYVAVAELMLFFPDGKLPGPRWRWVAAGLPAVGLAVHAVMVVTPGHYDPPYGQVLHPFGDLPSTLTLSLKVFLFPTLIVLIAASAFSIRGRFRRGDEVCRAQLKWLALAGLALPGTVLLSWTGFLLLGTWSLGGLGLTILYTAVPIAVTIAIARHNLYDVDRALSAAVTYGAATSALLAVFVVASVGSGILLGRHSVGTAATITALSALALAPARRRLQQSVDRRVYPMRRAAQQGIDDLHISISADRAGPEQLQEVLRVALRDPELRVGFLLNNATGAVDSEGDPLDLAANATPVSLRGQQIGVITSRGPATEQLLREVASTSGLLVEMGRLRLEVSQALREVASSRSRLLQLGYEERRRLERDLHDGAQQRLVSLGMALRLAQRHLGDHSVDVDGLLDEAVTQLGTAVAELREVAHGVRPSCLDDGLHPALAALARSAALPVELEVNADRAIPDDIATTAYFVVSEAVANAVKHAGASRIGLRICHEDGQLQVRIQDDGRGGATLHAGSGLAGISDRVAAAGGSLRVHSTPGHGTVVEARLPCAS
ncbi:MAG: hypothetical protein NVS3B26_08050 [Mycobacteriales bacterium]